MIRRRLSSSVICLPPLSTRPPPPRLPPPVPLPSSLPTPQTPWWHHLDRKDVVKLVASFLTIISAEVVVAIWRGLQQDKGKQAKIVLQRAEDAKVRHTEMMTELKTAHVRHQEMMIVLKRIASQGQALIKETPKKEGIQAKPTVASDDDSSSDEDAPVKAETSDDSGSDDSDSSDDDAPAAKVVPSKRLPSSAETKDVKLLKEKFDERVPPSKSLSSSQTTWISASSSSSPKSMSPDLVPELAESSETAKKTSPSPLLREFLVDRHRGDVVDALQGEISVTCHQDVKLLKEKSDERVPPSKSLTSSRTPCVSASSSSSLKSMSPDLVPQLAESSETAKKTSPSPSADEQP